MKDKINSKSRASVLGGLLAGGAAMVASAAAVAGPPLFKLPDHAVQIRNGVYDLGSAVENGRTIHGYAFLHPRNNFVRPDNPGGGKGGKGGKGGGGGTSSCFTLLSKGARWKVVEDYILDSTNGSGMTDTFVGDQIAAATNVWNAEVSGNIFGSRVAGVVDGVDTGSADGKNEIMFADIAEANVIAVTITWGVFGGPPPGRELIEWDQVYDDVDFAWGDADTNIGVMDMLNIAAHEVGHAAGLDHPDVTCTEETMYSTATTGETKKRDLFDGDIAGVKALY